METNSGSSKVTMKKEIGLESIVFPVAFVAFFGIFVAKMGMVNTLNTFMNTAYSLLIDTVFYITAICVLMGAISALFSEFGLISLANKLLKPLMKPIYGLPGAAALGVITTFLSDNPAILTLADDKYFKRFFKAYQFPALTNLGTAYGMGLIVCTYMLSLSAVTGESYGLAVLVGFIGAVIGSIVSTRIMMAFTVKIYGKEKNMVEDSKDDHVIMMNMRPVRSGGVASRLMGAILEGGESGVKMGVSVIPGVLIICTIVMMLTNGPGAEGVYTGGAYEGIKLLPYFANKISFILTPLFGFSSPEAISVPVTALGAAGAAIGLAKDLIVKGLANAGDIAVFTSMCMCWSGYLSTHVSMMNALNSKNLIGKAILSHTIGGLCAGISAHWIYIGLSLLIH